MVNAGLGFGPVPTEFRAVADDMPAEFERPISESATFINVVHFIKTLGQNDFQGEIYPQNFQTAQYPLPVIGLRVPPGRATIKRAYVIWALQIAINHMYLVQATPTFWTSHYTLLWNDDEIGGLSFGLAGPVVEQASQTIAQEKPVEVITARNHPETDSSIDTRELSGVAKLITAPAERTTDVINDRLSVTYTFTGSPLGKVDLYCALLWVMAEASRPASNTRILTNWIPPWLQDLDAHTTFFASAARRDTAPFMTFSWLLEAVAGAADYFVARNRWGDLRMQLAVDGVPIGQ
ncbi:MAG: hypothetical protein Q9184_006504, partial [Pyrenodesmia sp. 2 TL-2023]